VLASVSVASNGSRSARDQIKGSGAWRILPVQLKIFILKLHSVVALSVLSLSALRRKGKHITRSSAVAFAFDARVWSRYYIYTVSRYRLVHCIEQKMHLADTDITFS